MKALGLFIFFISTIAIFYGPSEFQAAAEAQDYYVDGRYGLDQNPGTSSNAPWKKIAKANNALKAGDTVYIKAGTYAETIRPVNSGEPRNYITYTSFNNGEVIIGGAVKHGAHLSDRSWVKIEGLHFTDVQDHWMEFEPNGSNNYIANNIFDAQGSSMGYEGIHIRNNCNNNKFINNSFTSKCLPKDLMMIESSDYNLVDGNFFGYASHVGLNLRGVPLSEYNIIRNNTFENPYHTAMGAWRSANHSLIEGNIIINSGSLCGADACPENTCGSDRDRTVDRSKHTGMQIASQYNIIRRNVLANNGRFTLESFEGTKFSVDNRVYNNTFHGNYIGWRSTTSGENPLSGNTAKNNIFSDQILNTLRFSGGNLVSDNRFVNNFFTFASPSIQYLSKSGIDAIELTYTEWEGNRVIEKEADPGFKNKAGNDFKLNSESVLIDAAEWLTVITSSTGSGKSFTVADAKYFSDGFGIISGDSIQIQNQSTTMVIVSVNYDTNTIMVDRTVSWKKGDGLSLPYTKNKPDIGAFEYGMCSDNQQLEAPFLTIKN